VWKWLFAGVVVSYSAAVAVGSGPYARYLFREFLVAWGAGMAAWMAWEPLVSRGWVEALRHPVLRAAGRWGFVVLVAAVSAEGILRGVSWLTDARPTESYVLNGQRLAPRSDWNGCPVNRLGYWDQEFQVEKTPGVVRIAAVGDWSILSGTHESNVLSALERALPGTEIYNFSIPEAGPREYAAMVATEVNAYQPDLVLVFLSVGDDIASEIPLPGTFDYRSLDLFHYTARVLSFSPQPCLARPASPCDGLNRENFLALVSGRIAVCRTPMDERMLDRWDRVSDALSDLVNRCRSRETPVGLVIIPAEFQVDPHLRRSLCRRTGCKEESLDLELPQRKLTVLAHEKDVPMVDLLPHFAASPRPAYVRNHFVWNEVGNQIAADVVGDWLASQFSSHVPTVNTLAGP
jgi:hypothetical protein